MNCEKITYYIEKGHLTKLNLSERLQVKLHKMICNCCKNYAPDSKVINDVIGLLKEDNAEAAAELSNGDKDQLRKALEALRK